MAKLSRHRANGRKAAKRFGSTPRRAWMLSLRRKNELWIPDAVIEKLAALNLPPNEFVYQACLEKLLRGA